MKSQTLRWVRHAARIGAKRNLHRNFCGQTHNEEKILKVRCEYKYNIKIDLQELELEVVYWLHMIEDRHQWRIMMNKAMNHRVP
jgi:hypothetical protein